LYAPWCSHCRRLEPIYEELAKEIQQMASTVEEYSNVRVVRVDATVYSDVANKFDVRGYPTIKFIRGGDIEHTFTYEDDRTKVAILEFIKRVNGPSLRWLSSIGKFTQARSKHDVFFILISRQQDSSQQSHSENDDDHGNTDDDKLIELYKDMANRYLSQSYFYATNASTIIQTYFSKYKQPVEIFAVKSEGFYRYDPQDSHISLEQFFINEKSPTYAEVTIGNIHDMIVTRKLLIIYGYKPSNDDKNYRQEVKNQIGAYALSTSKQTRSYIQFCFTTDLDLLSNIAVWTLPEPLIFLYNSSTHYYGYYLLSPKEQITDKHIDHLVENQHEIIIHPGNTFVKRLFRPFWELYRTVVLMFIEAPFISMLVVGLPAAVISIVCYFLCCLPSESSAKEQQRKDGGESEEDEEDEASERILNVQPKFIENFKKPKDAKDIPTWPQHPELLNEQKTTQEKKRD
ncbi:unnamed protein product, partial [Didymodactylos carnosus]